MLFRKSRHHAWAALLLLASVAPSFAADAQYSTQLDPSAFDNSTVKNNAGIGHVTATLSGSTLTITGDYSGMNFNATGAQVKLGLAKGEPGHAIGDLKVTGGTSGQISGSIKLTSTQVKALNLGNISVVVNNEKAGQFGSLWGWLAGNNLTS
ncbi:MAG TPA: hypothetical protein VG798_02130 [Rhizomicrobium sp.]|nr:hypothetical protein [Rhizomicrobium sp.]